MTKRNYTVYDLGFHGELENYKKQNQLENFQIGRIAIQHKDRYTVMTETGVWQCELIGNLRFTTVNKTDLPAVGDWVAINPYDLDKGLIYAVYPRQNVLERRAVHQHGEKQIIATNIDFGLIMQSVNRDFSINRLERYIAICYSAKMNPVIILNKIDLIDEIKLEELLIQIKHRIIGIPIFPLSTKTRKGLDEVASMIQSGKTYCLLGSSGVGKSTLINCLVNTSMMKTGDISEMIDRGKHITTHRELMILDSGGIIIDNPGMREVGITEDSSGLDMTFDAIHRLEKQCKFKDCTHQHETGCAVLAAVEAGDLPIEMLEHYLKLQKEQVHFSDTIFEKRKKDKAFGKMVKQVMKNKNNQW